MVKTLEPHIQTCTHTSNKTTFMYMPRHSHATRHSEFLDLNEAYITETKTLNSFKLMQVKMEANLTYS